MNNVRFLIRNWAYEGFWLMISNPDLCNTFQRLQFEMEIYRILKENVNLKW